MDDKAFDNDVGKIASVAIEGASMGTGIAVAAGLAGAGLAAAAFATFGGALFGLTMLAATSETGLGGRDGDDGGDSGCCQ
jgi:hypothetical protein